MKTKTIHKRQYVLHPGYVFSEDDKPHFIDARRLANLYGVIIEKAIVYKKEMAYTMPNNFFQGANNFNNYVHLYPRTDGNYKLPDIIDGAIKK